jgi:biopolymer transport protein TolR
MAFSLQGGGPKRRGRYRPLADINVTPLVDVMLVLLIVFMVTAPLMTSGVNVDLPKTDAAPLNQDSEPLTVSVNAAGNIYLGDTEVPLTDLVGQLQAKAPNAPERRIFVRGDKGISYGRIMEVMGTITQGGFTKVALLAEQPSGAQPASAPSVPTPDSASQHPSAPSSGPSGQKKSSRG